MTDNDIEEELQPTADQESVYDSSNVKQVSKKNREDRQKQRIRDDGFKEIVASPLGRAWVWNLLSEANVFSSTFSLEPAAYGLNEGKRSMGLMVIADIQRLCPEMLTTMIRENQEKAYG